MPLQFSKENLYTDLISSHPEFNSTRLEQAFSWAHELHSKQLRKSGEPYIIHPVELAKQLMNLEMDEDCVIAGLLHDVMEDCGVKYEEIKKKFGITVADLVQAETKVDDITSNAYAKFSDYNNLKRMLLAMTDDIRVIIIRLSDRLHNMKTIEFLKPERQISYSQETLNVYVPLAEYINIGSWKRELEDIAFKHIDPEQYELVTNLIEKDPRNRPENIQRIKQDLENLMKENKIPCEISGRVKGAFSVNTKINTYLKKGKIKEYATSGIFDLLAFRIITNNNNTIDCYKTLGAIHAIYDHIPEEFDDYISRPKNNGYQSLQTDIFIDELVAEIQIRTKEMHEFNEFGVASHISYKLHGDKVTTDNSIGWVKNLVKWQSKDNNKFSIKNVLSDKIFVFTPKGEVMEMTKGASVIDFAYRIHTKIGNSCTGAKVNNKIVSLETKIQTGDIIEILTSKNKSMPNKEWINFAQTKTISVIKREISKFDLEKQIESGRMIFRNKIKEAGLTVDNKVLENLINDYAGGIEEDFFRRIGIKMINLTHIIHKLKQSGVAKVIEEKTEFVPIKAVTADNNIILIKGHKGMQYYMAKCCNPKNEDELVGFLSLEHGVTVHKKNCRIIPFLEQTRIIEVTWGSS